MGHHYTSTYPGSHFTTGLMLAKHVPGRHITMTHDSLTVRTPGGPTEHRPLREDERHEWLSTLEPRLTSDEHARLLEKLHTLAIQ
jgi:N-hydroxyarylamine O-acetyltransferase